jgi:hypothetical protein
MIFLSGIMLFVLPRMQRRQQERNEAKYYPDEQNLDTGFPEIVEELEGYDSDDHQMTMKARA